MRYVGKLANGSKVFMGYKCAQHMEAHSEVSLVDIREALSKIDMKGETFYINHVDLGRVVGKSGCVPITPKDKVRMYYRKNREGMTPFVFGREPVPTSCIVVGVCYDARQARYKLVTAFYGNLATREPWDRNIESPEERAACVEFWNTHALIYDEAAIDFERSQC